MIYRSICSFWKSWKPGKNPNESDGIAFARPLSYSVPRLWICDCDDATASSIWACPYPTSIGIREYVISTVRSRTARSFPIRQSLNEVTLRRGFGNCIYGVTVRLHNRLFPHERVQASTCTYIADAHSQILQIDAIVESILSLLLRTFTRLRTIAWFSSWCLESRLIVNLSDDTIGEKFLAY